MNYYLDTSAIVAALVVEQHSDRMLDWLERLSPGTGLISDWTHVEVASALSLKHRTGQLSPELRAQAVVMWQQMHAANFPTLAVTSDHFDAANRLAGEVELSLRAGDALHVAIARDGAHTLVTLDRRMAAAALQLGIPVERI